MEFSSLIFLPYFRKLLYELEKKQQQQNKTTTTTIKTKNKKNT